MQSQIEFPENIIIDETFHPNGQLSYESTLKYIDRDDGMNPIDLRISDDGRLFVRVGTSTKYRADGSIQWQISHNPLINL